MGFNWAFVFIFEECCPESDQTKLKINDENLSIYAVRSIEEGAVLAKRIIEEEGCELIELCGGFGAKGAQTVIDAIKNKVPVGHIEYLPEAQEKLRLLFG